MFRRSYSKKKKKLLLDEHSLSTDQIRLIRSNIDLEIKQEQFVLLLTSPSKNTEKAIISAKLAIAYAELKKTVLLVDANFRSPGVHELFDLENSTGLSTIILNEKLMDNYAMKTHIDNLSVIPTGPRPDKSIDLWIGRKINDFVERYRELFDIIIIEAPEYLMVSETQVLVKSCDGIVLVVKEHHTDIENVIQANHQIERSKKKILGVIYQIG